MSNTTSNGTTVTYNYNSDGSYVETVVSTDGQGAVTTKIYSVNAQRQLLTENVTNPDGSTSQQAYTYLPDGGYQVAESQVNTDGSRSSVTYTYDLYGSLQRINSDTIAADGSQLDTSISPNSDGSSFETVAVIASDGQMTSTTNSLLDAQGHVFDKVVTTSTGTDHTQYQYFLNSGDYRQVTENVVNFGGTSSNITSYYNPDGSLQQVNKEVDSNDGSRVATTINYNQGFTSETVTAFAAGGLTESVTNTAFDFQGRLILKDITAPTVTDDRTQYQYYGDSNTYQQVTENVVNADGSRSDTRSFYNMDGTTQTTVKDAIAVDGSRVDAQINYGFGGSGAYQETDTVTSAGGQVTSTTYTTVDPRGRLSYKSVSTPVGTDNTQYQYWGNGNTCQQVTENVVNADGSRSDVMSTYNQDGTYAWITKDAIAADGSRVDTQINYNFGGFGAYQETDTATTASGQVTSTTNTAVDPQGHLEYKSVSTPAGTDNTEYQYFWKTNTIQQVAESVVNADGSRSDVASFYNLNGTYASITKDAIAADGSRVDTQINYQPGQWAQEVVKVTDANGLVTSTTSFYSNPQGQVQQKSVATAAGTDNTTYQYFANGGYQQVTENITNADGSRINASYSYNWDGTYYQVVSDAIAADGSQVDTTKNYNPDGSYQETVTSLDANGQQLSQTTSTVPINGATYTYNSDGSYVERVVSTDAQGATTTKVYSVNAEGQLTSENITNPDGSTSQQSYDAILGTNIYRQVEQNAVNADGSRSDASYTYSPVGFLQQSTQDAIAVDRSRVTTAINYNADQSYQETITATDSHGVVTSTTSTYVNAEGQLMGKDVNTAAGTDDNTQYQYFPYFGGYQQVEENALNADGSRADSTTSYNSDGTLAQVVKHSVAVDGSRVDTTISYNPDQSHQEIVTATDARGQVTSTTNSFFNNLGQLTSTDVSTPDGTDHGTHYQYAPGTKSYLSVGENIVNADGSRSDTMTNYNPDGTVAQIVKDAIAVGGSRVDTTINYSADQSYQETVTATDAHGLVTSTTNSSFNGQGELTLKDVITAGGDDRTQYQYLQNSPRLQQVTESVANADGSRSDSTTVYNPDGTYEQVVKNAVAADGSRANTTVNYNSDQSYQEAVTAIDAHGLVTSMTNSSFNSAGRLLVKDVSTSAGTDDRTQYYYSSNYPSSNLDDLQQVVETVTNANGSHSDSNTTYNPDGTIAQIWKDATTAGGSRVDTTITYNPYGYQETDTATAANGQITSTTNSTANAQGQVLEKFVSTPGGTDDTHYQYSANGAYHLVTEHVANADGSHSDASYYYNWDGSYHQVVKTAAAADGSQVNTTINYNPDGSYQEAVVSTAPNGGQSNQNSYAVSLDGSYSDSWTGQDGSHGTYGWDVWTSQYQATWYDSNGTSWTDDYQYAAGGSPQTGGSFLETFDSSDGSTGTRQYDASTGIANISWHSGATGYLSGTSQNAAGFVGLQNDGELTNTQSDLNFFNPAVSPAFNAFLTAAEPHA